MTVIEAQRRELLRGARAATSTRAYALRCRIVLACAEPGAVNTHVAADLGVSAMTVAKWRRRFIEHGLVGLATIIAALLYTGARMEECERIDLDDVAITARTGRITLRSKGDEVHEVPLPAVARQRLADWIAFRSNESRPAVDWSARAG